MPPSQGIVNIRLELEGEQAKMFEKLKKIRGFKNSSELVRQLIVEAVRRDIPMKAAAV